MPTSSQAMILRGSDCYPRHRASVNFRFGNPFLENTSECETSCKQQSPSKERTEIVNFDFSVSTSPDPALNLQGFEGAFSFDEKTKSYRWHIYAVTPKEPGVTAGAECGDHNDETGAFMQRQISDTTRHFTTPAESLLDNSVSNTMEPNPNVVNIPVYGSRRVEDAAYKRLEELGFRRRTVYSPSGNLFRLKRAQSIVCSPKRCSSEQQTASESIRKLAITNLDTEGVPYQKSLAYKRTGVEPRTIITTDAIRKRLFLKTKRNILVLYLSVNLEPAYILALLFSEKPRGIVIVSS
ncbi:hypothetical protein DPMN_053219 [Dreissena polymorpha]|uniref:Uncharacterized protein n=1 Tax=Dreissena polymorpha TaxID=45954 RepID=A0A9D4CMB3_DREPO|nr:hypothetical protein DPMN_053219 [Dreissena polymorpha]